MLYSEELLSRSPLHLADSENSFSGATMVRSKLEKGRDQPKFDCLYFTRPTVESLATDAACPRQLGRMICQKICNSPRDQTRGPIKGGAGKSLAH